MANYPITYKRGGRTAAEWIEEFALPEPNSGCWLWTRYINTTTGYGQVNLKGNDGQYVRESAHRLAYELYVGPIPDGLQIDHLCRNRACCNPDHLEPVTSHENLRRVPDHPIMRKAEQTHCKWGHEFTPENTYWRPDRTTRQCIACAREATRKSKERNPERLRKEARTRRARGTMKRVASVPLPADDSRHGSLAGYGYWRCRCEPCKEAKRAQKLAWLARKADPK